MRFACESCHTRYTLADEKVKGRELKIRCKTCSAVMVVRDPALARPDEPAFADEATRSFSADEAMRLAREAAAGGGGAAGGGWDEQPTRSIPLSEVQRLARGDEAPPVEWFAMRSGQQVGPLAPDALAALLASGELGPRNYVWREGMADWQRIQALEELGWMLAARDASLAPTPGPSNVIAPTPGPAEAAPLPAEEKTPVESVPAASPALDAASLFDEPEPTAAAAETPTEPDGWSLDQPAAAAPRRDAAPAPAPQRGAGPTAKPKKKASVLRLVAAGVVLAALVAGGAFFFLPSAPAPAQAPAADSVGAGRLRVGDVPLPAGSPLDRAAVRAALATRLPGYERCVADHARGADRSATITVRAVVAPSGSVTAAQVAEGPASELGLCLADRTRDIRFPSFAGEPVELALPFAIAGE